MQPGLIAVVAVVGAVLGVRWVVARGVQAADAARPRDSAGVLQGAAGFVLDRPGAPGVLLLHGAGDTPQTLRGLGEFLHDRGFAVSAPLLPGHGRSVLDFRRVTSASWRAAASSAYEQLAAGRPWTGLAGLSMGGALAALTVVENPAVPALVLIAPYLELPRTLRAVAACARLLGLVVPYLSSNDTRSVRDPAAAAQSRAYGVFTPAAIRALRDTADAASAVLGRIRTPTLIVQSRQDNRVAVGVATRAMARLGATEKQLEWISTGGHVITVDYGRERVFALTYDWLCAHGAGSLLRS
jgi:carboxylesterase